MPIILKNMPAKKSKSKKKVVAKQPQVTLYRNIAIGFLFVTVILLAIVAYMSVKKVGINVTVTPQSVQVDALARVGEKAQDMPHVSGVTGKLEVGLLREFAPTGTEEKQVNATGSVTLINETGKNQPLVATTRLLSPDGKLFRLTDGVTVPAQGEVEAAVYADMAGGDYEIGPTKFTIPGLWEPLQEKIYAVSETSMAGGLLHVGVVSADDIKNAKNELRAALLEEARLKLAEQEGVTDAMGWAAEIESISFEVKGDQEKEVASFSVSGTAIVVGALYNQQEIINLINGRLQEKVAREPVKLVLGNALPEVHVDTSAEDGSWLQLGVTHSGTSYLTKDSPALDVLRFYGKTGSQIEEYVRSIEGVEDVSVRFRPAWSDVAPRVPEHIDVTVKTE